MWQGILVECCWHKLDQWLCREYGNMGDVHCSMSYDKNNNHRKVSSPRMWYIYLMNCLWRNGVIDHIISFLEKAGEGGWQMPFCTFRCIYLSPHNFSSIFISHFTNTFWKYSLLEINLKHNRLLSLWCPFSTQHTVTTCLSSWWKQQQSKTWPSIKHYILQNSAEE